MTHYIDEKSRISWNEEAFNTVKNAARQARRVYEIAVSKHYIPADMANEMAMQFEELIGKTASPAGKFGMLDTNVNYRVIGPTEKAWFHDIGAFYEKLAKLIPDDSIEAISFSGRVKELGEIIDAILPAPQAAAHSR